MTARTGSEDALLRDLAHTRDALASGQSLRHKNEMARVLALPREDLIYPDLTPYFALPGGKHTLRPIQSKALHELNKAGGLYAPIKVGGGKTAISHLAGVALGRRVVVLFTPATNVKGTIAAWNEFTEPNFRTTHLIVRSYAALSQPDATDLLRRLIGGFDHDVVIVCDEASALRNFTAARTRRMARFLEENTHVPFVALTGTPSKASIKDFAHLANWALGERSPLPAPDKEQDLRWWSEALDCHTLCSHTAISAMDPLVAWAGMSTPVFGTVEDKQRVARRAFGERQRTCPGVVTSQATDGYGGWLRIVDRDLEIPPDVTAITENVAATDNKPNGDAIVDDADEWRTFMQLSAGFYLTWEWPDNAPDEDWLRTRKRWHAFVRAELKEHSREGYDSPLLVTNRVEYELHQGAAQPIHSALAAWRKHSDKRFHGKPTPPTRTNWISGFLLADAIEWANAQTEPVILWYTSRAVGEALASTGIPVYGAGVEVPEWPRTTPDNAHTCAMSISAHFRGKNLQWCGKALVLQLPSSGERWEQLLGRTHRDQQPRPGVEWHIYQHTPIYERALKNARAEALYLEDTTGYPYKLTLAEDA